MYAAVLLGLLLFDGEFDVCSRGCCGGKWDVVELGKQVLKIDENHAEAYNRRATNLMLKGRMQEAAVDIQKVFLVGFYRQKKSRVTFVVF